MTLRDHMIVQNAVIAVAALSCMVVGSLGPGAGLLIFAVAWYFLTPNDPQP